MGYTLSLISFMSLLATGMLFQLRAEATEAVPWPFSQQDTAKKSKNKAPAPRAVSKSGDGCSSLCNRVVKCGFWSYGNCMDFCKSQNSPPGENLAEPKWSCQKLATAMAKMADSASRALSGPSYGSGYDPSSGSGSGYGSGSGSGYGSSSGSGEWSCRAVGSYAPPSSNGGPDYSDTRNVEITKYGPTRDVAGIAAIDACSDLLAVSANTAVSPGSLILDGCAVIRCSQH